MISYENFAPLTLIPPLLLAPVPLPQEVQPDSADEKGNDNPIFDPWRSSSTVAF